jgi:uncharacterized Fe-S center protein
MERMVEARKAIASHFGKRITYINVLKNISVDCDCLQNGAKPTCNDIGILASTDILAIDKASVDLIYAQPDAQRHDIMHPLSHEAACIRLSTCVLCRWATTSITWSTSRWSSGTGAEWQMLRLAFSSLYE